MGHLGKINLDIAVSQPDDWAGRLAMQAMSELRVGHHKQAAEGIFKALAAKSMHASTWSNLAAYALATGNMDAALERAQRALRYDPDHVDAWVNLAGATFAKGRGEESIALLERAVAINPAHAKAVTNLATLLLASEHYERAELILSRAASGNPDSAAFAQMRALAAHPCRDHATTCALALDALGIFNDKLPSSLTVALREKKSFGAGARPALLAAMQALEAAGQPYLLMAGTLLGIVRDGDLIAHDKDIDLALPFESDRDSVAEIFRRHPDFSVPAIPVVPEGQPLWAFGVVHAPSGVVVDLFFARHEPDGVLFGFGLAPREVFGRVRPFAQGTVDWQGRACPAPMPPEQYLEDVYGPDWRQPDPYFDTVLSNPSRTEDSLPWAINLGLLRLIDALAAGDWKRAHSLCLQLLARRPMDQVVTTEQLLRQRCAELRK